MELGMAFPHASHKPHSDIALSSHTCVLMSWWHAEGLPECCQDKSNTCMGEMSMDIVNNQCTSGTSVGVGKGTKPVHWGKYCEFFSHNAEGQRHQQKVSVVWQVHLVLTSPLSRYSRGNWGGVKVVRVAVLVSAVGGCLFPADCLLVLEALLATS